MTFIFPIWPVLVQIADFIAGATRSYHENSNDILKILDEKISIARRY